MLGGGRRREMEICRSHHFGRVTCGGSPGPVAGSLLQVPLLQGFVSPGQYGHSRGYGEGEKPLAGFELLVQTTGRFDISSSAYVGAAVDRDESHAS